jgi:hypothetical protein
MKTKTLAIASVTLIALLFAAWAATRSRTAPAPEMPALVRSSAPVDAAAPPVSAAAPSDALLASVPRIDPMALRGRMERGEVVVIDVRDIDSYTAQHIAGAIHIPLSRIEGEVPYLRGPKPIVAYCT